MEQAALRIIARMKSDFPTKFGVPRQSGMVPSLQSIIAFEPDYRTPEALRGLEDFSHIWVVWGFSEAKMKDWSPTVRPPRLGGNKRIGVFATRSPFRPNSIGLSAVKLEGIEQHPTLGPLLHVAGADLIDGTPIYDIKPYIPYADCHPEATGGFVDNSTQALLQVEIPPQWKEFIPGKQLEAVIGILAQDPRPQYQDDSSRIYGMEYAGMEIRFTVAGNTLTVREVTSSDR